MKHNSLLLTVIATLVLFMLNTGCVLSAEETLQRKIQSVDRFWEYGRDEYISLTRIRSEEGVQLVELIGNTNSADDAENIKLLLVLNCIKHRIEESRFSQLRQYICDSGSIQSLMQQASTNFSNLSFLIYVKPQDRDSVIKFLDLYVKFWKKIQNEEKIFSIGASNLEYLLEIRDFLKDGGYWK